MSEPNTTPTHEDHGGDTMTVPVALDLLLEGHEIEQTLTDAEHQELVAMAQNRIAEGGSDADAVAVLKVIASGTLPTGWTIEAQGDEDTAPED